jgi:hypothetical protein
MEQCPICQENMDVPGYIQGTTEITLDGICTRLQCGHALHTTCMVRSLQTTGGKCVMCNRTNINPHELSEEQYIRLRGECLVLLKQIKRIPDTRDSIVVYKDNAKKLKTQKKEFLKRVKDFKTQLRGEMGIDSILTDLKRSRSTVVSNIKREARKAGPLYVGALDSLSEYQFNAGVFGRGNSSYRSWVIKQIFF